MQGEEVYWILRGIEMDIEYKSEPIEHWIVDGKAYRLATEADIGKECYFDDNGFENAMREKLLSKLRIIDESIIEYRFVEHVAWKYAYVQDDSLLSPPTPQRTPVPELGPGWYLLRDDEVLQVGDKVNATYGKEGWIPTACAGVVVRDWRQNVAHHVCARNFGVAEFEAKPNPIDWTKPVRTKDGRSVRVLCTDGPGAYPVAGYVDGEVNPRSWTLDGYFHVNERHSTLDLENAPQRIQREYWVNVYDSCLGSNHDTKEDADYHATCARLACVKIIIDCEEGEGL